MMIMDAESQRVWKEGTVSYFNVLLQQSPSVTEENHETYGRGASGLLA
jgi:hypothetical protein